MPSTPARAVRIQLIEEGEVEVEALTAAEALEIQRRYGGRYLHLDFPHAGRPRTYVLRARSHVGLFPFGGGKSIHIEPKVAAASAWAMLLHAGRLAALRLWPALARCARVEEVFEVLVGELVQRLAARCQRGLHWDYRRCHESGPRVRGRLLGPDGRRPWHMRYSYDEGGVDGADNRILLWTLYHLRHRCLSAPLRRQVEHLFGHLRAQVRLVEVSPRQWPLLHYHRLNADYRPMHLLCRFLLGGAGPGPAAGPVPSPGYALHMPSLFEACMANLLRQALGNRYALRAPWELALEGSAALSFRLDMAIVDGRRPLAVLDAKYKLDPAPASEDVQQVVAYAVRLGAPMAVLLYPEPVAAPWHLRVGAVQVHGIGVDLAAPDPAGRLGGELAPLLADAALRRR